MGALDMVAPDEKKATMVSAVPPRVNVSYVFYKTNDKHGFL
jgi:hypothetical protein